MASGQRYPGASHIASGSVRHRRPRPWTLIFLDFLAAAGQRIWQTLPLCPTGSGDSPYSLLSAFAGNPLLISPELLADEQLLHGGRSRPCPRVRSREGRLRRRQALEDPFIHRSHQRFQQRAKAAAPQESRRSVTSSGTARRLCALHGAEDALRRESLDRAA